MHIDHREREEQQYHPPIATRFFNEKGITNLEENFSDKDHDLEILHVR